MRERPRLRTEVDRDIQADRLLSRAGEAQMVALRYQVEEIFEPFTVARYQQRRGVNSASRVLPLRVLSGPAPSRSFCSECRGPKKWGAELCRVCEQKRSLAEFERVVEYWLTLWRGYQGDFTAELIERIHQHEKRLGPAAFWPRAESVVERSTAR